MPIDFKHQLDLYPLLEPTKTNIVFLTIKSLHKHRNDDVEERIWHEDDAKAKLRAMKPYELRRMFNTQMYREFCEALQQSIDNAEVIYNLESDSIVTNW